VFKLQKPITAILLVPLLVSTLVVPSQAQDWPDPVVALVEVTVDANKLAETNQLDLTIHFQRLNGSRYSDILRIWFCPVQFWIEGSCQQGQQLISGTPNSTTTTLTLTLGNVSLPDGQYLITNVTFRNGAVISGYTLSYQRDNKVLIGSIPTNLAPVNIAQADFWIGEILVAAELPVISDPAPPEVPQTETEDGSPEVSSSDSTLPPAENLESTELDSLDTTAESESETEGSVSDPTAGSSSDLSAGSEDSVPEVPNNEDANSTSISIENESNTNSSQLNEELGHIEETLIDSEIDSTSAAEPEQRTDESVDQQIDTATNSASVGQNSILTESTEVPTEDQVENANDSSTSELASNSKSTEDIIEPESQLTENVDSSNKMPIIQNRQLIILPLLIQEVVTTPDSIIEQGPAPTEQPPMESTSPKLRLAYKQQIRNSRAIGKRVLKVFDADLVSRRVGAGLGQLRVMRSADSGTILVKVNRRIVSNVNLAGTVGFETISWYSKRPAKLEIYLESGTTLLIDAMQINNRLIPNPSFIVQNTDK